MGLNAEDLQRLHGRTESGRFEVVPNGFGGTTTRRAEAPEFRRGQRQRPTIDPMTDSQGRYLRALLGEREGVPAAGVIRDRLNAWREQGGITKAAASKAIEDLKAIPAAPGKVDRVNQYGGRCESCGCHVQAGEGRLSKADDSSWQVWHRQGECPPSEFSFPFGSYAVENAEGELRFYVLNDKGLFVQASDELHPVPGPALATVVAVIAANPLEACIRYGLEFKRCGRCGRGLTDENSRAAGIGPVCATKEW